VWRARRRGIEGDIALKIIHARWYSDPEALARSVRLEAGRARRILSNHVIPVYDAGQLPDGRCFVEMGLVADPDPNLHGAVRHGSSLRADGLRVGRPRLGHAEAARIVADVCEAVQAAHDVGVIHGDVKPDNVLITPDTRVVRLGDFGEASTLAAVKQGEEGEARIGTPGFMAPEQWDRKLKPDVASDVYCLGGTLFFLLTGDVPHPERVDPERRAGRCALPDDVPRPLRHIVQRALAPAPGDRYRTAAELRDDLRASLATKPLPSQHVGWLGRAALFARRHAAPILVVALIGAAAGGVAWSEVVRVNSQLAASRTELGKVNADLEGKQQELTRSKDLRDAEASKVLELRGEQRQLEASLVELKQKRDELYASSVLLKDLRGRHGELQTEARRLQGVAAEKARLEEENGQLRQALALAEAARAKEESAHEKTKGAQKAEAEKVSELTATVARLGGNVEAAKQLASSLGEQLRSAGAEEGRLRGVLEAERAARQAALDEVAALKIDLAAARREAQKAKTAEAPQKPRAAGSPAPAPAVR
jgi:hypothetical protein